MRAAVAGCLLLLAGPALAAERAPESGGEPLEILQREIGKLEAELAVIAGEEDQLSRELHTLSTREAIARRELEVARAERTALEARVAREEALREEIGASLISLREEARAALREIYKQSSIAGYSSLLSVSGQGELMRGVQHLEILARRQREAVESYLRAKEESEEVSRRLAEEKLSLDRAVVRSLQAAGRHAETRRSRMKLLSELENDKEVHLRATRELRRAASELEAAIASLPPGAPPPTVTTDFATLRGSLPWPARGRVAVGFGRVRNRRFGTVTPHNGLEILSEPGVPIRAVAAGQVVFSRRYGVFGRTVVIDHGGRYLSVYAKLAAASVEEGDPILPGEAVGLAAEGSERGKSSVYFEIRHEGKALDPEPWLRKLRNDG